MHNDDRHRLRIAAYAILADPDGKVLFTRRSGTGYMDGKLGLPSGHLELKESFKTPLSGSCSRRLAYRHTDRASNTR